MIPALLSLDPPIDGMDMTIAPNDGMFVHDFGYELGLAVYLESARTALNAVKASLAAVGKTDVRRILDLPCGHGRILRILKAAFPDAELTACDIDRDGVDFCARQFNAEPIYSVEDPARIPVEGPFDLIWCGSLLTHIDAPRWPGFLKKFRSLLAPDGVCIFTTHGVGAVEYITHERSTYGVPAPRKLLKWYQRYGFAYMPYHVGGDYGISMSSPAWVVEQIGKLPETRLVMFLEKGWHNHQDVVAFGPLPEPEWVRVGL